MYVQYTTACAVGHHSTEAAKTSHCTKRWLFAVPSHQLEQGGMWKEERSCCNSQGEGVAETERLDAFNLLSKVVQVPDATALLLRSTYRHKQLLQWLLGHSSQMTRTVEELKG